MDVVNAVTVSAMTTPLPDEHDMDRDLGISDEESMPNLIDPSSDDAEPYLPNLVDPSSNDVDDVPDLVASTSDGEDVLD